MRTTHRTHSAPFFVVLFAAFVLHGADNAVAWDGVDTGAAPVRVPISDGRIEVAQIARALSGAVGFEDRERIATRLETVDWSINTRSCLGRCQLAALEALSACSLVLTVDGPDLVISNSDGAPSRMAGAIRNATNQVVQRLPFGADGPAPSFGITLLPDFKLVATGDRQGRSPRRVVMLVHGLDDPGWIFNDLIPVLQERGYAVARFEYPNDGPIEGAADLFAESLRALRADGVERIDVVAHSMGGLVTRDLLTRESHYAGDGAGTGELPAIDRLIMVGTPNHGSQFARLRALAEIREQVVRVVQGDRRFGQADDDGSGEAAADLLPGSDFLNRLNSRPPATHTTHSIIAARMSPVEAADVNRWTQRLREFGDDRNAPGWLRDFLNETIGEDLPDFVGDAVAALGDGVVTIESACLEGVTDFTIVEGNHMSMLTWPGDNHELPPSIPIILDRLERSTDGK